MCSSIDPTTCFEASKAHIFTGRCGLSRQRLYTNDSSAKAPRAPWMKRAKGPNSSHSPLPGPGLDDSSLCNTAVATAVTIAVIAGDEVEEERNMVEAGPEVVLESIKVASSTGIDTAEDTSEDTSFGDDIDSKSRKVLKVTSS